MPPSTGSPSWPGSPAAAGSPSSQAFLPGRPVVLEAKQEAKTKTNNSAVKKEDDNKARPKKKSRMKPSEITWKTCLSLPDGWKTRIVFWSDREKPLFLTPTGKTLTSRKAVLAAMEVIGGYSQEDFEKVKKGSHKRKKKPNNQWVQTKKKGKRKGKGSVGKVKETKGQKKTANRGEKKSEEKEGKAKAKEGKAKPRAPRGLSRALTKLAKQYVGYLDGEGRKKLRHCHVNLNPVAITEAERKMAVEMLSVDKTGSVESEMSSRPIPDSSLALPPSRPESQEGKNSSPAFSSNLPSSSSTSSFLAPTSSSSLPPTLLQSDSSLTDLKPDQSSSNLEEKKEEPNL